MKFNKVATIAIGIYLIVVTALCVSFFVETKAQAKISADYEVEKYALDIEFRKAERTIAALKNEVVVLNQELAQSYIDNEESRKEFDRANKRYQDALKKEKPKEIEKEGSALSLCDKALALCKVDLITMNTLVTKEKEKSILLGNIDQERLAQISAEQAKRTRCETALNQCFDNLKVKRVSSFWKTTFKVGLFALGAVVGGVAVGKAIWH